MMSQKSPDPFQPVKSKSGNHAGYRIEPDNSLTIKFANGSIYNFPKLNAQIRDEYIRRTSTDESNGKYFNRHIRGQDYNKLEG
jgi:KTSC domain-containing protein